MPVKLGEDKEGCYAKFGDKGKKYYYECKNTEQRKKAKRKAILQGVAVSKSGGDKQI
jgi:hypothetical protein